MSSRYVWNRYTITSIESSIGSGESMGANAGLIDLNDKFWGWTYNSMHRTATLYGGPVYFNVGTSYSISNGQFVIGGTTLTTVANGESISTSGYDHISLAESTNDITTWYFGFGKTSVNSYNSIRKLYIRDDSYSPEIVLGLRNSPDISMQCSDDTSWQATLYNIAKGQSDGTASNATSTAYPPRDNCKEIYIICAIVPLVLRRCYRG